MRANSYYYGSDWLARYHWHAMWFLAPRAMRTRTAFILIWYRLRRRKLGFSAFHVRNFFRL